MLAISPVGRTEQQKAILPSFWPSAMSLAVSSRLTTDAGPKPNKAGRVWGNWDAAGDGEPAGFGVPAGEAAGAGVAEGFVWT